jgi:methylmalonyl-CoA mutase cobalamin-binding domain/chain
MTVLHVCGDTTCLTENFVATGAQALSLDSKVDLTYTMEIVPDDVVIIGNIDPVMMSKADPARVRRETEHLLQKTQNRPNFVLSTGCLLPPNTPVANIDAFMSTARTFPRRNFEEMQVMQLLNDALLTGDEEKVVKVLNEGLNAGYRAEELLNGGLIVGMGIAGMQFQYQEIFIPELLLISQAMYRGLTELKPHLVREKIQSNEKIVIGTVQYDLHEIGKNLVANMLEGAGYDVINLGADVSPEQFIDAIDEHNPKILGLSGLTTTAMNSMEETIRALEKAGVRDKVKVIVGGAPVFQEFAAGIGADGYAPDAVEAVEVVADLLV